MELLIKFRLFILSFYYKILSELDDNLFQVDSSNWERKTITLDPGTADDHIGNRSLLVRIKVSPQKDIIEIESGLAKCRGLKFFSHQAAKREIKKAKRLLPSGQELIYLTKKDHDKIAAPAFFFIKEDNNLVSLKGLSIPNNFAIIMANDNGIFFKLSRFGLKNFVPD